MLNGFFSGKSTTAVVSSEKPEAGLSREPCARSRHPGGPDAMDLRYSIHTDSDYTRAALLFDMDSMHGPF